MDKRNDAELLTEFAADGCHAAFAALVNRHGPMAHGIAMRVLSNHHDAQDVTQAVFILLARDAKKLASSPSVAGWIHTVTRRLALNAQDSRGRRQRREHTAMEHATTTTTLNLAQEASCRRELDAAIAQLPERYRQPLLLVHLEGEPMEEVAKRLSLQPETLRTRLSRACGKLRELLSQRGVEITSVAVLSSFLTNELQASSAFSPELASTILDGAIGGASVSPHVLALTAKGAISTSISLSAITLLMNTKTTIIATVVTLAAIGGAILQLSNNRDSTTSVVSGSAQTAKPFTSAGRDSQGNPSSRKSAASTADDHLVQVPREVSQRFLKGEERTIIEGRLPGKLTWSKDSLALLGLDEGQQTRLQEALDQASARALEVMKRTIKTLPSEKYSDYAFEIPDWSKDSDYAFEIPDWSKEEGVAIRAELTKALERELTKADAELLMKLANEQKQGERLYALFGEGQRKVFFSVEDGSCRIKINVTKDDGSGLGSVFSIHDFSELPTEWMDLYKLPAEYQVSVKASIKSQEEREREVEKQRNEIKQEYERRRNETKRIMEEIRKQQETAEDAGE